MSPVASPAAPVLRSWLSPAATTRRAAIVAALDVTDGDAVDGHIHRLVERNREIHERQCINLNPASNVMNPRAEALLAAGLTTRASLGHPGEKYETGLEAIEELEVVAAELAATLFVAEFVEYRVGSGALANLYAFMATCAGGDPIVVPPATIGGHITHRDGGAAGLYGLQIHEGAIDPTTFSYDLDALDELCGRVRPRLVTIGTSLNLLPHPVAEIAAIAHRHGARLLFDAAHACGLIAGGVWANPLDEGADLMTMSTYKSLGGPAGGLVVTRDADIAARLDAIAYPGLTANFDVAKTAALAITLLDWLEFGRDYAATMVTTAAALAGALAEHRLPLFAPALAATATTTASHQLAIDATTWGGGDEAALRLRHGNLLACAIGLPGLADGAGLRLGTPEIVRLGMGVDDMPELAELVAGALTGDPAAVADRTSALRRRFPSVQFVRR